MSKLINIKLTENHVLDPSLELIVHELALRHPLYTFGTKGMTSEQIEYVSYRAPKFSQRPDGTPAEIRFLGRVRVNSESEELGYVNLDSVYTGGSRVPRYELASWRLGERENAKNSVVRTTKLNVALRTFKKFFVPRAMQETYGKAFGDLQQGFSRAIHILMQDVEGGRLTPNRVDTERYAYLTMNNLYVTPTLQDMMTKAFATEKYATAMSRWVLARNMKDMKLHPVVAHNGGYLYMRDPSIDVLATQDKELQHLTFDDMPELLKNNLAVLQLCKDNEVVKNVGYRHASDLFLVAPEIRIPE
jgi:hypothetical protein